MSFTISPGIPESELKDWILAARKKYGRYLGSQAADYTRAPKAPTVLCTVACKDEILLVKRGFGLADAEGYWSTVNGFIDVPKPVKEIVAQEILEELGVNVDLSQISVARSYTFKNSKEKRAYIIFPCLVEFTEKPTIKLDREHTDFAWIKRPELESFHILDDLPIAVDAALALRNQ